MGLGIATIMAGVATFANLSSQSTRGKYTYSDMRDASLQKILTGKNIQANSLWKENGAIVFAIRRPGWPFIRQQARQLAALDLGKVPLYAIVLENKPGEPEAFALDVLDGNTENIMLDDTKAFFPYKNHGMLELFRPGMLKNVFNLKKQKGDTSNYKGEFRYNGGVLAIGPEDQGLMYHFMEGALGDQADPDAIMEAVANFKSSDQPFIIEQSKL